MTIGSINNSVRPFYFYNKDWNGDDGRLTPEGTAKWNKYVMYLAERKLTPTTGIYASYNLIADIGNNLPGYDNNLEIKALNKTIAKAKGHSFNLAVTSAESRQTIRLVKDTVLTIGRSALALKNGNIKVAVETLLNSSAVRRRLTVRNHRTLTRVSQTSMRKAKLSDIGQKWLELQYGWGPLYNDVYEGMSALHASNMRKKTFNISSTAQKIARAEISNNPGVYTGILKYQETCNIKYRWTNQVPVDSNSLGLHDPATVAWELLPFSFVADWFLPIGPYLEAANQLPLLKGEMLMTKFLKGECPGIQILTPSGVEYLEGCTSTYKYIVLNRSVFPAATHSVPLPSFKTLEAALSPLHIANGIALLSTVLSSDKRHDRFDPVGF